MSTFEDFYSLYPRKKARADARKAWEQALRKGFMPDEIMAGLSANLHCMRQKEAQFVPYPATWLRAEGWADEPDIGFKQADKKRTLADAAKDIRRDYIDANWIGHPTQQ